jgi:hypothetical protein
LLGSRAKPWSNPVGSEKRTHRHHGFRAFRKNEPKPPTSPPSCSSGGTSAHEKTNPIPPAVNCEPNQQLSRLTGFSPCVSGAEGRISRSKANGGKPYQLLIN